MPEQLKAHCPKCDGERNCDVYGVRDVTWSEDFGFNSVSGDVQHRLLECRGCETVFYYKSSSDSESWDVRFATRTGQEEIFYPRTVETFPAPDRIGRKPDWVAALHKQDPQLQAILQEAYAAHEAGSYILASVGLRTALDRATELLAIDPGLPLVDKVSLLQTRGFVGETEANDLSVVANAGSAAAHRGWRPDQVEFEGLLGTLERFLERTIVNQKSVAGISIPPPHPRPKKAKNNNPNPPLAPNPATAPAQ